MLKILLLDIETAPKLVHVWGLFNQNVALNQIVKDMYVLNWSARWAGEDYIYSDSLHYHKRYETEPENDIEIIKSVWEMMNEADVIVGHNCDGFDIPTLNGRFIQHGLQPPSSYKSVDTLAIARQKFKFTSNKLDFISRALGVGQKMDTGGFQLWEDIVIRKDKKAFDKMVEYCENDVLILEKVYLKLRPWATNHPKMDLLSGNHNVPTCNVCGSNYIHKMGKGVALTGVYQRYKCVDCGHNMRSRHNDKLDKEQNKNVLKSC